MTLKTAKNPDGFFSSSWFEGLSKPENQKGRNPTFAVLKNQSEKQKEVKQTMKEIITIKGRPA